MQIYNKTRLLVLFIGIVLLISECSAMLGNRYGFYRQMDIIGVPLNTRRIFGGSAASLEDFPGVCALVDRKFNMRCSGSIIKPSWVLTAAHCITNQVVYVKYNTRYPKSNDGNTSTVLYLFRHPEYEVVEEDQGRGMDVTLLHNDVGLIQTSEPMVLKTPFHIDPMESMRKYRPYNFDDVTVLGFGRSDQSTDSGEELFSVKLKLIQCDRAEWIRCICGQAFSSSPRGVCSGDSGGPVLRDGAQIAVTSMGPLECATRTDPGPRATSVFTALYDYNDLLDATITDTKEPNRTKMAKIPGYAAWGAIARNYVPEGDQGLNMASIIYTSRVIIIVILVLFFL